MAFGSRRPFLQPPLLFRHKNTFFTDDLKISSKNADLRNFISKYMGLGPNIFGEL